MNQHLGIKKFINDNEITKHSHKNKISLKIYEHRWLEVFFGSTLNSVTQIISQLKTTVVIILHNLSLFFISLEVNSPVMKMPNHLLIFYVKIITLVLRISQPIQLFCDLSVSWTLYKYSDVTNPLHHVIRKISDFLKINKFSTFI